MTAAVEVAACPLCDGRALAPLPTPRRTLGDRLGDVAALGLVACRRCGFEFVSPRPSDAALAGFYAAADYTAHEPIDDRAATTRAATQLDLAIATGATLGGARVLDLGAGGGQFLAAAQAAGATVLGVDPSPQAQAAARARGLALVATRAEVGDRRFDLIAMSHVLEHVVDVRATLRWIHDHLAPGGRAIVEVPNRGSLRARLTTPWLEARGADCRHRAFPIHLSYFTAATLTQALATADLAVIASRTTGLGLDALWPRDRDAAPAPAPPPTPPPTTATAPRSRASAAPARGWRRGYVAARDAFHRARLGENLVVIAAARGDAPGR